MENKLTQKDFEFGIGLIECGWDHLLSGVYAKEYEDREIPLTDETIKEINVLLEELEAFQKSEKPWCIEKVRDIYRKSEEKMKFILDEYKFVKTKEYFAKLRDEIISEQKTN